jgi:predicted NBD/HSP70 family sugar kinase
VLTPRDSIGQRSETVRRANLSAIATELHEHGPLTRSRLVARTGLTRSAIRTLIGEFLAAGLVTEERSTPVGTPGRPSRVVRPNPERAYVLALEIAVDSIAAGLVGFGGAVIGVRRVERPRSQLTPEQIVADLAALSARTLHRAPARGALIGVGVAVVGVVRREDGLVRMAPNLGWIDAPLAERLELALALGVPVSVANEADLGAMAEHRRGAAQGIDDFVYISGEVGVGGGLILGGRAMTGVAGYGGEIGHVPLNPEGRPCGCGGIGCWETEIGEGALLRRAGYPEVGGREAVEAVMREAAAGSPTARRAVEELGRWLGIGLAGLANTFNPELIVLGGLFHRIYPLVAGIVESELDRRVLPAPRASVRVVSAAVGEDAPLLGAAEMAFEPLLADPAAWLRGRALASAASA